MPAAKRVIRRRHIPHDLVQIIEDYLLNRSMRERADTIEKERRQLLMDVLAEAGIPQEGGHRVLPLDDPLEVTHYTSAEKGKTRKVTGIERKRRASMTLNEERTLALLAIKGLTERCTTTITVLDEDAVLAANYSGDIDDDELKALYDESETFAFYLIEE